MSLVNETLQEFLGRTRSLKEFDVAFFFIFQFFFLLRRRLFEYFSLDFHIYLFIQLIYFFDLFIISFYLVLFIHLLVYFLQVYSTLHPSTVFFLNFPTHLS